MLVIVQVEWIEQRGIRDLESGQVEERPATVIGHGFSWIHLRPNVAQGKARSAFG